MGNSRDDQSQIIIIIYYTRLTTQSVGFVIGRAKSLKIVTSYLIG